MTRGARPCFFSSLRSRRLAAFLSRRLWTRTSSTTPSWSTARQSQCVFPLISRHTSSRCHLSPGKGSLRRIWLEGLPELEAPLAHGLMAHVDAAGRQHLFDHAQAERKAEVEPHRVADDLAREAVAGVGGLGGGCHAGHLPVPAFPAKPRPKLTVPSYRLSHSKPLLPSKTI